MTKSAWAVRRDEITLQACLERPRRAENDASFGVRIGSRTLVGPPVLRRSALILASVVALGCGGGDSGGEGGDDASGAAARELIGNWSDAMCSSGAIANGASACFTVLTFLDGGTFYLVLSLTNGSTAPEHAECDTSMRESGLSWSVVPTPGSTTRGQLTFSGTPTSSGSRIACADPSEDIPSATFTSPLLAQTTTYSIEGNKLTVTFASGGEPLVVTRP